MIKILVVDDDFHLRKLVKTYAGLEDIQCDEADNGEYDRLLAFNLGADDYVPKPFSPKKLIARVNAVYKRTGKNNRKEQFYFGDLIINESAHAAVEEVDSRLSSIVEDLKTVEISGNTELITTASKSVRGKTLIFDQNGNIFASYSNSHPVDPADMQWYADYLIENPDFQSVLEGNRYEKVFTFYDGNYYYDIGIPVTWNGERAVLFLSHPIEEVYRVQSINRRQMITLSILLTVLSSLLAWFLSKQFARPILEIKGAVERLAQGELTARPNLKLKDELGALSDSVAELSQALQRVDILRKEVIANVSHELSAPLSLIIGYSEMVRDVSWPDGQDRNDNLNLIIREARRMSTMVDDIMDYSQIQAGYIQLHKAEYNLYDVIESEIDFCRKTARDFSISVVLNTTPNYIPVYLDALKIS